MCFSSTSLQACFPSLRMDKEPSMVEYLTGYLLEEGAVTEASLHTFRPSVCNRLDRNTSGIVAAGQNPGRAAGAFPPFPRQ